MYATSQPNMARKYGVIRSNRHVPPQQLMGTSGGLSAATVEGLKAAADFQKKRETVEGDQTPAAEAASAAGPAGQGARLGQSSDEKPLSPEEKKRLENARDRMDDFDFHTLREMMMKDILNNEDQRAIIEARCPPLSIDDILMRGFVTQRVPIIPGRFEPEFQSMEAGEDITIKRLIMRESKGVEVGERYLLDKFSLMSVTLGVRSINGSPLPAHKDENGKFDEARFWQKFEFLVRYPFHMLGSLGVNYFWFDIRVRKLFVAEKLGNG